MRELTEVKRGRRPRRRAAGRPRAVPPRGRSALDRPDRRPPRRARRGGAAMSRRSIVEARGRGQLVLRADPALRGANSAVAARRDPRRDGPERLGQVHAAALPGRHPRAGLRRGLVRRRSASTRMRETDRSALRRDRFGFVFQFGQLVPELTAEENVALPLLLGGVRRRGRCAGRALVRPARPRRARAAPLRRAVGWPGAAGGAGPRAGRRPGGAVRRRADRLARLADRRAGDGPAGRRRPGAGHHRRPRHPRARVAAYADREVIVRDGTGDHARAARSP